MSHVPRSIPLFCPFLLCATSAAAQEPVATTEERLSALEAAYEQTPPTPEGPDTMRVFWKDGLRFASADKRYTFKLGGRIHYDGAFLSPDDDTKAAVETGTRRIEDGTEFRRARIEMSGEVPERVEWAAGYDFGPGRPVFRNLYAGLLNMPFGANVRAGQMKEPFGLEQITSSNNMTFLERSLTSAAEPAYNAGLLFWDAPLEERMSWAVGAFRAGTDDGEISKGDGEWAQTARVTGLPYISEDGKSYLHLGLSATNRSLADDLANFAAKPENNIAPPYLEIVNLPVDGALIWRPEVAWTKGRIALQGEYTLAELEEVAGGSDEDFTGWYAQVSWFLTGEHRPYKKNNGSIGAVKPKRNAFAPEGGSGAWELAARYSQLDFSDVGSGELDDATLGLNWYLNPNTRVMLNYIHAMLDPAAGAPDGDTDILAFRVQFAF